MEKIRLIVLFAAVSALIAGHAFNAGNVVHEEKYLAEIAPDIVFSPKQGNPPHFPSVEGIVAFNSYDVVPSLKGYAGPIKVLIALRGDGMITGLKILEHTETKNYVHYMEKPAYLRNFIGKSINDPFEVNKDIDGISRATVSVKALARTVRDSSRKVAFVVYGMDVVTEGNVLWYDGGWILYAVLFLGACACYILSRRYRGVLGMRDLSLALGIAVIGVYLSTPFSILHVLNLFMFNLSSSMLWYVIVATVLLSMIFAGRFYCGWLCPFGALSEFIGRLPVNKWKISEELDDRWRMLKYILLVLVVITVFLTGKTDYGNFEVYLTLFSLNGNPFAWVLMCGMLIINVRIKRFWCRYICPVASFGGLITRKDTGYVSMKECPMGNKQDPLASECIRCNQCYRPGKSGS